MTAHKQQPISHNLKKTSKPLLRMLIQHSVKFPMQKKYYRVTITIYLRFPSMLIAHSMEGISPISKTTLRNQPIIL